MVFSNLSFLYYFLPATLILYFITPMPKGSPHLRNIVLLAASLVFYAWGEPVYVLLMIAQCLSAWGFGLLIDRYRGRKASKAFMLISMLITLSGLVFFKYTNFIVSNVSSLLNMSFSGIANTTLKEIALPIGISFYSFQILSYTFDLYRGNTDVQRNPLYFSTYVTLFPQLIAGPIVRYVDVTGDLVSRKHSTSRFALCIRRFIIGLGKKMLLANLFGELVSIYKQSGDSSLLFAWIYIVAFALQIYYDFSAYSDMAIGLGHIFGFTFLVNFNYPYIADSITDFWRRWHMSLSSWFRDYVYIPLGGNRVSTARAIFNIMLVWLLTGFWHGADWNFVVWGGFFGVVLLIEKFVIGKLLAKAPMLLRHAYVVLIVLISWVFFDSAGLLEAFTVIARMSGFRISGIFGAAAVYYLRSYAVTFIIGIIGATPIPKLIADKLSMKPLLFTVLEPLVLLHLLIASTARMVDGSFNPFIYFRF